MEKAQSERKNMDAQLLRSRPRKSEGAEREWRHVQRGWEHLEGGFQKPLRKKDLRGGSESTAWNGAERSQKIRSKNYPLDIVIHW